MAKHTGLGRFYYATCYSLKGLKAAFVNEPAFRYEVYGSLVLMPLAGWVAQNAYQLVALVGVCLLVLTAELINTAIEAVVDRAGTEFNPLAGVAKDTGSAAVFLMLILGVGVWGAVLCENFG
jgi:diacylglycerol kinase (ATP)